MTTTDRRRIVATLAALAGAALAARATAAALTAAAGLQTVRFDEAGRALAAIEARAGGRLGVQVIAADGAALFGQRPSERFPMCGTFRMLAAAHVLQRVERGQERLDRVVRYAPADLVANSPATTRQLAAGMSVAALCEAALTVGDRTAGNLLLASFGGPLALTRFARSLGDDVSRLDRMEVALNEAAPGDERDTTTPAAMARNVRALLLGHALGPGARVWLLATMRGNRTGDERLRAGLPVGSDVADRTGSGGHGTAGDIGLVKLPGRAPVIVAAYLTGATVDEPGRDAAIADVGRLLARRAR